MGFGKAQKKARNIARKKMAAKLADEDMYNKIASMDDKSSYTVSIGGKKLLNGIIANGKFWKHLHGIE